MFTKILRTLGPITIAAAALTLIAPRTHAARIGSLTAASPVANRIIQPIDEHVLVTLKGNVRQDLAAAPDLGPVEDGNPLHLYLLLQRTTAQQAALDNLIERQQQPTAAEYHKWLTPKEFGARFGASPEDIAKISAWLESHGFQVREVLNNASMIDFAGTAGQVREAFHTELHYFNVRGGKYVANVTDPEIPAALAPVVAGIKGLAKFPPLTNHSVVHQASYDAQTHRWHIVDTAGEAGARPAYNNSDTGDLDVTPQDLYTIYNVNPVFTGGDLAASATVAVIEESDMEYGTVNSTTGVASGGDVATFRSLFGVPGTLNMHVYHGYGTVTCNDPGIDPDGTGEDEEASLDAEWINATAPSANLIFMSCDQSPDDGIFTSMTALIDNNISDVMSMSYDESEIHYLASDYSFQDTLYAQAAAQGQSIFISTGDAGSDVADQNTTGTAKSGINVNAFVSPLVTGAGGTDFSDLYDSLEGGPAQSAYWSATNSTYYGDALSYVPEMAWNESCASSILAAYEGYTGAGLCATGYFVDSSVVGGSGGISTHYAVPAWQSGISGYSNSHRSQPDIAGFASAGFWYHALIFCDSNSPDTSVSGCTSEANFGEAGGTSFVAPYMAGVAGLLVDYTGSRQGLLNPALYALGKAQFTELPTACYSNGQASNAGVTTALPAASCIFNDVTTSNNDVPCKAGSSSCYVNSGQSFGMLSLNGASSLSVAYPSTPGFDQATGIGSVNVSNLITGWSTAFTSSTGLGASPTSVSSGESTELTATVTGGTPTGYVDTPPALTGTVTFNAGTTPVGSCPLSSGTCQVSVAASALQTGANSVTATFLGSGTYPSSTSSIVTVTVTIPPSFALSASPTTLSLADGSATGNTSTVSVTPSNGFTGDVALTCVVAGPEGATSPATCSFNPTTPDVTGTTAVTSVLTIATTATTTPGSYTVTATGTQGSLTSMATVTVTVTPATQTISFPAIAGEQYASGSVALAATASSGLPVSFASTTTSVCTVSGSTASLLQYGNCTIEASQAGNDNYAAAPTVSQTFLVHHTPQTISFAAIPSQVVNTTLTLSATASSGLPVSFASTTTSVCTVSGTTATLIATGTCSIEASQAGNTIYQPAANVGHSFSVTPLTQTISFPAITGEQFAAASLALTATASSGLPVSFASTTSAVCTVSGSTASLLQYGNCTIQASQAGNTGYSAAPTVSQTFLVHHAPQTISFAAIPSQAENTMLTLSATASSGLPVSFASTTTGVCTVSGTTASLIATGTCTLEASQAGNTVYQAAANVGHSFSVTLPTQTISFPAITGEQYALGSVALAATASSGLPVSFASTTTSVCTVSGSTASLLQYGNCTIEASQAGDAGFKAAPTVSQTFLVHHTPRTISFAAIPSQAVNTMLTLSATASSGLPVSFSSTTTGVCTVSGTTATLIATGTCSIEASQAGNTIYQPAANVERSFSVAQ